MPAYYRPQELAGMRKKLFEDISQVKFKTPSSLDKKY